MSRWGDAESGYADSAHYQEDRGDSSPKSEAGVVFRPAFGYHLWVDRGGENGPMVHPQFGGKFVSNGFLLELIFNADLQLISASKIDVLGKSTPMDVTAFPAVRVNWGQGYRDVFQRGDVWKYEIDSVVFAEDVSHLRWI
jgi:hypothetical protein